MTTYKQEEKYTLETCKDKKEKNDRLKTITLSTLKMETMENEIKDRWRRRFDKIFNGTTMVSSSVNDLL